MVGLCIFLNHGKDGIGNWEIVFLSELRFIGFEDGRIVFLKSSVFRRVWKMIEQHQDEAVRRTGGSAGLTMTF